MMHDEQVGTRVQPAVQGFLPPHAESRVVWQHVVNADHQRVRQGSDEVGEAVEEVKVNEIEPPAANGLLSGASSICVRSCSRCHPHRF